ncbi:MAG TPA: ATP-dependent DNA ligase [Gemmatimonadales bacterium]|nr:ATP-dependent DNA ligase [Gemmatimonadales bacterium]
MSKATDIRFADVAAVFSKLETTSARGRTAELVAGLLKRAGAEGGQMVAYLLQGQLRPPFEGVEIGVGEKLLIATIAQAYGVTGAQVSRKLGSLGDLGRVAEALAPTGAGRPLTLGQAYQGLLDVAQVSGAGSIEQKTRRLAELLLRAGPLEARFLVRAAQGRLRLGVGDQTILEAAALGALGDRRLKPLLERAYNVRSDLGGVVRIAFARGRRGLDSITPEIGVPVRPALAQRMPSAEAIIARLGRVQMEPKYDGFRLQFHRDGERVWAFSRRLEDVTEMFPDLAEGVRRQLTQRRAIIEGEAVVHNPATGEFLPFQVTMTRKRKTGISEAAARHPLRLFAFDLLYLGRQSCLAWPQARRSRELRGLIRSRGRDPIAVTDAAETESAAELSRYFTAMIARGLEGVMAKRPDAPYQAGARGYDWVKLKRAYQSKLRDTVDLVLVGYLRGRGKRAALGIGSVLAAVYDPGRDRFRTVAKIGSGLSEAGWRKLKARLDHQAVASHPRQVDSLITPDVWVTPSIVVEVLADEITRSPSHTAGKVGDAPGYALRFPRMLGERADRSPQDATTEKEILRLHRLQRSSVGRKRGRK